MLRKGVCIHWTPRNVLHYRKLVDSLITENECLLTCIRAWIVVLARLWSQVLQLIHLGHFRMQ